MENITLGCEAEGCKFKLIAEINTTVVPEADREKLMSDAKEHFIKQIKKHHEHGHPKGENMMEAKRREAKK